MRVEMSDGLAVGRVLSGADRLEPAKRAKQR